MPTHETIVTLGRSAEVNARNHLGVQLLGSDHPNGSVLEGATNLELPVAGHFRILDRPDLLETVALALSDR